MNKQEALERCKVIRNGLNRFTKRLENLHDKIESGEQQVAPGDACQLATIAAIEAEAVRILACGE